MQQDDPLSRPLSREDAGLISEHRRDARLFAARSEPLLFALFAGCWTLGAALFFYSSMRQQILMLYASLEGTPLFDELRQLGPWSAPLDDVFIHFDFARATARGYPFQWCEGNGYSTGTTSILYPFVLAVGYWLGFRQLWLMVWAGMIACVSVLTFLLATRRIFRDLPRWTSYLLPPVVLSVGGLGWTFFSGMEVALFMALWGAALVAWDSLLESLQEGANGLDWASLLGVCGFLMVATRPEAVTTVALFSISACAPAFRRRGVLAAARPFVLTVFPTAAFILGQFVVNLWITGEASAAGAVAKLELYDPFHTPQRVFTDWFFFVRYQVDRLTQYHLADDTIHGWMVWVFAVVPLLPRTTRRYALLLWACLLSWILLVAFNGQVRWQNERYAMPALTWLLGLAALGMGALAALPRWRGWREGWPRIVSTATTAIGLAMFLGHQYPRFREQVWFFGRASRNILEQHAHVGLLLLHGVQPPPQRVALGDAGAIPYVADLPALDLIGLGGYHGLPFARAKRIGVEAVLELVERMPPTERPDVMALYPSWWDALPVWFGERMVEVPVRGNVICGGASKVIYQCDWSAFAESGSPFGVYPGEAVVDGVDIVDVIDERLHRYALSDPHSGRATMKILPHPERPETDLWDGGRLVPGHVVESFVLRGFEQGTPARLVFRVAVAQPIELEVLVGGKPLEVLHIPVAANWQHATVTIPTELVTNELALSVRSKVERESYHLWAVQKR